MNINMIILKSNTEILKVILHKIVMSEKEVRIFITHKLVEAREGIGLTQEQLSKLSGISQSKISKIENGARYLEASQLYILSKVLKKSINFFFPISNDYSTTI